MIKTALLMLPVLLLGAQTESIVYQVNGGQRTPISPFVYGHNHPEWGKQGWTAPLSRVGGNRLTAYNWETNASNAGSDSHQQYDKLMGNDVPGEAVRRSVAAAHEPGAA